MSEDEAHRSAFFSYRDRARTFVRRLFHDASGYDVVLYSLLLSRLALLIVGLLTQIEIRPITTHGNDEQLSALPALQMWGAWDTGWYVDIALHGYQHAAGADGQANWAFFPAYPGLASILSRVTGLSVFGAMLCISNLSFLGALLVLHRLARVEFDRKMADLSVVLLCVAPGSYIFSAAYTESLFLFCLCGAFLLIRSRRWLAAGIVTAAAVLTRNLGVGLLLPFAWEAMTRVVSATRPGGHRTGLAPEIVRMGAGALAPVVAVLAFMWHLQARTGDPLAFVHVQSGWGRVLGNPLSDLLAGLVYPSHLAAADLVNFAAAWVAIGLLVALVFLRRPPLLLLAVFLTMVPLAAGIASFARYALVIVPLWLVLARYLAERPKAALAAIVLLSTLNGFMMVAWTLALKITI